MRALSTGCLWLLVLLTGCSADDPTPTPGPGSDAGGTVLADSGSATTGGPSGDCTGKACGASCRPATAGPEDVEYACNEVGQCSSHTPRCPDGGS